MVVESPYEPTKGSIITTRYQFIVGIDFGTFFTSISFAHVEDEKNIITVQKWHFADNQEVDGRFPSACLYENMDGLPRLGKDLDKRFSRSDHLFHTSSIKSYLTDVENQNKLPEGLDPIKLVADYLQQVHKCAVLKMKEYFKSDDIEQTGDSQKGDNRDSNFRLVEESQIRYIISYPDNQGDDYLTTMRRALEMAGIISPNDPPERLVFKTESQATAYSCSIDEDIKYSNKPYLVCNVGGAGFGISTIKVLELSETGTVEAHIDQSSSIELDRNMRIYLTDKILASDNKDIPDLERVRKRVFDFYVDNIKFNYDDSIDTNYEILDISIETGSSIHSECFDGNGFNLSHKDLRDKVFGPVVNEILFRIRNNMAKFEKNIRGIFISGIIGSPNYLTRVVNKEVGKANIPVTSMKDNQFAVSRGLIIFGFRENGRMVPYFDGNDEKLRHKVRVTEGQSSHSQSPGDVKTIDFSDVDYVIGLDFGTTYSGFAYAKTKHCNDPTVKHINVVKVVKQWPGQNDGNFSKAPSMLYYKDKKKVKFGTEAKIAHEKPKSSGVLLRHFKLLLSRDFNPKLDDTVMKRLNDLEIIDAIKDYLSAFNKKGLDILKEYERIHTKVNVGYIITIPSMWPDEAKNTMRVAVQKAGLVSEKDINTKVHFITEAEAAAMYCEKFYDNQFSMERDQRFMICDAGGGTVDLVTFKVSQEKKNGNKFIISELTSGDGDNFGSVFLDAAFEEYIINKFTENKINICQSGIRSIVAHFINDIKPNFEHAINPDMIDDYEIQIPSGIDIPHELSIPGFIENGSICIPYAKIEKEVFTPVIKDVLNLIKDQLEKLNENERQLDAILLVGGFGQSPYLYRRICDTFENKAIGARFIGRPPNGQLAICKGAVSFGLQPRMVSEGFTRYSYGLQVKDRFQDSHDDPEQKIDGYDGNKYCQNVFSTIIEKDATLKKGHVYIKKVHVTYPNDPVFAIYSNEKADTPRLTTELNEYIMKVSAKMPKLDHKKDGDKVAFELWFEISGAEISVEIYHEGKKIEQGITQTRNIVRRKFIADVLKKKKSGFISKLFSGRKGKESERLKVEVLILPSS